MRPTDPVEVINPSARDPTAVAHKLLCHQSRQRGTHVAELLFRVGGVAVLECVAVRPRALRDERFQTKFTSEGHWLFARNNTS